MTVIVQSKTMPVTQALNAFVKKQAAKVVRLNDRISQIRVYIEQIGKKKNDPQASTVKYQVKLPGKDVVVKRKAVDMYKAVVEATERAMRQVRKSKERRQDSNRNNGDRT